MKYKIKDYKGKTINKWTVLKAIKSSNNDQHWLCKCQCGLIKSVRTGHLIRGISKGCRYCRSQAAQGINSPYWKGGQFISASILTSVKFSAKKRKISFKITIEDLEKQWLFQKGICVYTGIKLTLPYNYDGEFNASLDRIDSSKGYIKNNIQWVLKEVNFMKITLSPVRFIELCTIIANYWK